MIYNLIYYVFLSKFPTSNNIVQLLTIYYLSEINSNFELIELYKSSNYTMKTFMLKF